MMGVDRSTYYYRSRPKPVEAKKAEAGFRDRIEQVVVEFARYGYRRVTYQLRREGWEGNHTRVARMMREQLLQCQIKRR
jgi:putative transposase